MPAITPDLVERFMSYVNQSDTCHEWQGPKSPKGYGSFSWRGGRYIASRVAYTIENGDPGDLDVCHMCDNPPCVNKAHLFAGTHQDNMSDMMAKERHYKFSVSCCPNGHEYDAKNTYYAKNGARNCRECKRIIALHSSAEAKRTASRVNMRKKRASQRPDGLNGNDKRTLELLVMAGEIADWIKRETKTQSDAARHFGISTARVTKMLKKLRELGSSEKFKPALAAIRRGRALERGEA